MYICMQMHMPSFSTIAIVSTDERVAAHFSLTCEHIAIVCIIGAQCNK